MIHSPSLVFRTTQRDKEVIARKMVNRNRVEEGSMTLILLPDAIEIIVQSDRIYTQKRIREGVFGQNSALARIGFREVTGNEATNTSS